MTSYERRLEKDVQAIIQRVIDVAARVDRAVKEVMASFDEDLRSSD